MVSSTRMFSRGVGGFELECNNFYKGMSVVVFMELADKFFHGCFKMNADFLESLRNGPERNKAFYEMLCNDGVVDNTDSRFFPMNLEVEKQLPNGVFEGRMWGYFGSGGCVGKISKEGRIYVQGAYEDIHVDELVDAVGNPVLRGNAIELPFGGRIEMGGQMVIPGFSAFGVDWEMTYKKSGWGLASPGMGDMQYGDPREPSGISLWVE